MRKFDKLGTDKFTFRYGTLVEGLKVVKNSTVNQFYIPFYFLRRFTYSMVIVFLQGNPKMSLIISAIETVIIAIFLVLVFPFESKMENIVAIYNEFTILLCFSYSFVFLEPIIDEYESIIQSYIFISFIGVNILINLICIFYSSYFFYKRWFLRLKLFLSNFLNRKNNYLEEKKL